MSKDIKKALEHCVEWNCDNCPNREELGSGEIVCRGRLLPEVLEYVADLEAKLAEQDKKIKAKEKEANTYAKEIVFLDNKIKLLKQEQKQLAIEELEKVKKYNRTLSLRGRPYIDIFINNQIKELKGDAVV